MLVVVLSCVQDLEQLKLEDGCLFNRVLVQTLKEVTLRFKVVLVVRLVVLLIFKLVWLYRVLLVLFVLLLVIHKLVPQVQLHSCLEVVVAVLRVMSKFKVVTVTQPTVVPF